MNDKSFRTYRLAVVHAESWLAESNDVTIRIQSVHLNEPPRVISSACAPDYNRQSGREHVSDLFNTFRQHFATGEVRIVGQRPVDVDVYRHCHILYLFRT